MSKKMLRVHAVSERLDITDQRTWELSRRRMLPGVVRIGRQIRVDEEALEEWIKQGGCGLPNPTDDRQHER